MVVVGKLLQQGGVEIFESKELEVNGGKSDSNESCFPFVAQNFESIVY